MRVLIACEESQVVTKAFIEAGHDAMSCDLNFPGNKGLPHFRGDVTKILTDGWDLMVGFPPCTYISNVQNIHYNAVKWPGKTERRERRRDNAIAFFNVLKHAPIPKIALENPFPSTFARERIGEFDQMVHPYLFGDPFSKKICLWIKGLPLLLPTEIVHKGEFNKGKGGRTNAKWYHDLSPGEERAKIRSRTFPGIAKAMAEQWG